VLQKLTLRVDHATAAALAACAKAEKKSVADVAREGVRMRLTAEAMLDPLRIAMADVARDVRGISEERLKEAKQELLDALREERASFRNDITEFVDFVRQLTADAARAASAPSPSQHFFDK
jgi:hypothetical protein